MSAPSSKNTCFKKIIILVHDNSTSNNTENDYWAVKLYQYREILHARPMCIAVLPRRAFVLKHK